MQHKKSGYNPLGAENILLQGSEPVIGATRTLSLKCLAAKLKGVSL
jgi:hypothetical protein